MAIRAVKVDNRFAIVNFLQRFFREQPVAAAGGIVILLMFLTGLFADIIAPYGINESHLKDIHKGPSSQYIMGTDQLGRDLFSRVIYAARVSMVVSLATAALCIAIATPIGILSGFFGGKVDMAVQRFVDAWMCFPPLFIILSIMAVFGPGMVQVIFVLGVHQGISNSRVMRSAVLSIKENVYVEAARSIGAPPRTILMRHILPNIMATIIVIFTLVMGYAILLEATVSFLGYGIPPPTPSWGGMLSVEGRAHMYRAPWMAIWPGLALGIAVFSVNMLGDGLREILDPKLRGGLGRYGGTRAKKHLSSKRALGLKK